MSLGRFELHAHPDLGERLLELADGLDVRPTAAFGIPCLADANQVIFAFVHGTHGLFLRGVSIPSPLRLDGLGEEWSGIDAFFPAEWRAQSLDERMTDEAGAQDRLIGHLKGLIEKARAAAASAAPLRSE